MRFNDFEADENEELFEHHRLTADANQSLIRIDKFLNDRLPNITRSKLQTGIKSGFVKVNGEQIKPNYKIKPHDEVVVELPVPPRDDEVIPEEIELDIVFEDKDLLVVNKKPGMVVHPAYNNWHGTLVNALAWHFENLPEMEGNQGRPGLVHRIDKDTSGLLVIAKTEAAMSGLARQFYDHTIERTYYAVVWGVPEEEKGTINVNIGRSPKDRRVMIPYYQSDQGKTAITHYELIEELRYVSLLKCNLETGRTHQIRAHLKSIGHPLFNDATYGGDQIVKGTKFSKFKSFVDNCFKICPRQALHAKSLGFIHPTTGRQVQFDSEIPEDMTLLIDKWQHYVQYN
jgi:23S rRNA pseudouridine1911/1915/1917 synthase